MDRNSGVTINESGHGGKDDGSSKGNIFIASTVKKEGGDSSLHSMETGDNRSSGSPFEGRELTRDVGDEHVNPFLGAETEEGHEGTSAIGATLTVETRREASEESADETENTDETTAREVKNDPSDAEKAIEANRQKALDEIRLREYSDEALDKVREDCDNLSFRECDGETITYSEALERMTDDAGKLLDRLEDQGREISDG